MKSEAITVPSANQRLRPFADVSCACLSEISSLMLRESTPQFIALGYWLRPAAIAQMRRDFIARTPSGAVPVPRGLAFHLPPTNVDTIFIYSWALSLLAGNTNITRLPSNPNPGVRRALEAASISLERHGLSQSNIFTHFPSDSPTNADLSAACDIRIIWGGDEKVRRVSALPSRPGAVTLSFPDRYSYTVVDVRAYLSLTEAERDRLAAKAFNDIFLFDQMACSSSQVIYWRGCDPDWVVSSDDFTKRCATAALSRDYQVAGATRMAKFSHANRAAIDLPVEAAEVLDPVLTSIRLSEQSNLRERRQGGGLLHHLRIENLENLESVVHSKDQTLTYFGFSTSELTALAERLNGCGIDRIVPIGEGLQFDRIWDGHDLLFSLVKFVVVR